MKIKKYQNEGFTEAFNNFQNKRKLRIAQEQARQQVQNEKPKYVFSNPYDITAGWRNATEDAAREDKYTALNLGATPEEAEKIYDTTWDNSRKQLATTSATVLPTAAAMAVSMGSAGPIAAHTVNAGFALDGLHRLASNNGIQKTIRLINQEDYPAAAKSAAGDLLDLSGLYGTGRIVSKLANPSYRAYHAYNTITPYSYEKPFTRGKTWIKSMLSESKYNKPIWQDSSEEIEFANRLGSPKQALNSRRDAWAIYTGQEPKNGMYIKNSDGTYSYNIEKFKGQSTMNPDMYLDARYDFLGNTHGGLHDVKVNQIDPEHGTIYIKDIWDLNPFERQSHKLISSNIQDALLERFGSQAWRDRIQKFREYMYHKGHWGSYSDKEKTLFGRATHWLDSPLNQYRTGMKSNWVKLPDGTMSAEPTLIPRTADSIIESLTDNKLTRAIEDKIGKFEVGPILGGKPFTMETTFPYTYEGWNVIVK